MSVIAEAGEPASGLLVLGIDDARYPAALRDLHDPPAVLYVAGAAEPLGRAGRPGALPAVAVVGARAASPYGLEVATAIGRGLAAAQVAVISGMAHGIDTAAHRAALDAGGLTVAVSAGDAGRAHPPSARDLHARIRSRGAIVSELGPGARPRRWSFPARNRLIAALAEMTVVVEAGTGSGALITAAVARRLGRRLGAVPGRVTSPLAAGPNRLIADGAALITGADDVLAALGIRAAATQAAGGAVAAGRGRGPGPPHGLTSDEHALWRALATGHGVDGAITAAGLSAEAGMAALAGLELGGAVARGPGGSWTVRAG